MFYHASAGQRLPLTIAEAAGVSRQTSPVTSGIPFPMGALRSSEQIRLLDELGRGVPLQVRSTATWRDGSIKWVLLDFQTDLPARATKQFSVEYGESVSRSSPPASINFEDKPESLQINTGPLRFSLSKTRFAIFENTFVDLNHNGAFEPDEKAAASGLQPSLSFAKELADTKANILAPEQVLVEESGPLRASVKYSGWITGGEPNRLLQYIARLQVHAGSPAVQLDFMVMQMSDLKMLWLKDISLILLAGVSNSAAYVIGGQPRLHQGNLMANTSIRLWQLQESAYTISNSSGKVETGFKSPGWLSLKNGNHGLLIGNRFFWQQFPKAFSISPREIRIGLYPQEAPKPFDMDQGLAKTHELYFEFMSMNRGLQIGMSALQDECAQKIAAWEHPLFAVAPAAWYCDSKVFGDLLPFDFDLFPDYETLTEASGDQFIKKMATGFRHWGDFYYGGEYKGTNSYMNLEYDAHHNFYCQFARTGLRKYLDAAITMGKHQADIDTNHKTGWQWKHSPRHVEIQAEFGHTFTRGLLETYFLTGSRRCFEAAIELGDYFAQRIRIPRELGNERQIGWSLISLLPVYEATWDKKYFDAARETIDRLLAGLDEKGKFKIRWDNRIAFFNGIAATGFIYYYRATGDERVAEAALKVIHRARGFYPEYAGRTLEAIAWAYQRTRQPEDLDFLLRTWETTMARQISWNVMELGAPTIFSVHALPFMAQSGFFPKTKRPLRLTPEQFDTANGMYAHHLPAGKAELWVQNENGEPFDLVIIRKGAWKADGEAVLYDEAHQPVRMLKFPQETVVWQRQVIPVKPARKGIYHLELNSETLSTRKGGSYITWDVATSRPMPAVFSTPEGRGLEFVTPYLFAVPAPGASKIELVLAGEGEGFKKTVIYDPDGHVAGSMENFIDLGDKGRYAYKVSAEIPEHQRNGIWSISLQEVSVQSIKGLAPYYLRVPSSPGFSSLTFLLF